MARRKDILGSFISAMEKEARRAAKEQEKINKLKQREYYRQEKLRNGAEMVTEEAERAVRVITKRPSVTYLSLSKKEKTYLEKDISFPDTVINFLKYGKRIDAINYYLKETSLSYNQIIKIIKYCENNLNSIIESNSNCWFDDNIGMFEFKNLQELIEYEQIPDYDKIVINVSCEPLYIDEYISSKNEDVVAKKAQNLIKKIADQWLKTFSEYHSKREETIVSQIYEDIDDILLYSLINQNNFSWDNLYDRKTFVSNLKVVKEPVIPEYLETKELEEMLKEYSENSFPREKEEKTAFETLLDLVGLKNISENFFNDRLNKLEEKWKKENNDDEVHTRSVLEIRKNTNKALKEEYDKKLEKYNEYKKNFEKEKNDFINEQNNKNNSIDILKQKFMEKDKAAVEYFFNLILEKSVYPILFDKDISTTYNATNNILEIDYVLPNVDDIYDMKTITYIPSKDDFKITYLKEKEKSTLYDNVLYQLCFRTIHEIFSNDSLNVVENIVFNGYSKHIDKRDGQLKTACILSVQISKENYENLNLSNISPKECFRTLKGVAALELATLTPVKPIMNLNKDDKRFVEAYEVMDKLDQGYNLATMDWQDFENLVREIFEKEFSQNGGEVKVTQSSRDGGVDAIAFDPDPIRGGKIVIQAKRYTNVVGVANVRDLYGTVMNEGAIKGILVTTSDYGSDSYEFAKDKPLTLLNGANLLHLLEKHGHKAHIDIKEAKEYYKNLENNEHK